MDFVTRPVSRNTLREYAASFRKLFGIDSLSSFPVLEALEQLPDVFDKCNYNIVGNNDLPFYIPTRCYKNEDGGYTIVIKNSIYDGAYQKQIGAYRGFICHEICHIFLFDKGYIPLSKSIYADNYIKAYKSGEWQAKALCGEVMMPYEATKNMTIKSIMDTYQVSKGFAIKRKTY